MLDTRNLNSTTTQPASGCRWLNIAGLCLFVALTLYANNEEAPPLSDHVTRRQAEGISSVNMHAEPAYYRVVKDASTKHAVDPKLIAAIIYVESRGNVMAVSRTGAKGLMQLTSAVNKKYDVGDPFDMEQNISGGTAYLAFLLRKFDGNLEHALAAYNCGPSRVMEYKGVPPIKETQDYVEQIMDFYLRGELPGGSINQES